MEPVETVAAKMTGTDAIRHGTDGTVTDSKPSRDAAPAVEDRKLAVTKTKTVTGRSTVTPLKTKHLLRVVEKPSRDESKTVTARPSRDEKARKVPGRTPGRTAKPDEPSRDELDAFKRLLPVLRDGRWTVENEGYGWKIRRVWDRDGTTKTTRYFSIRWTTWRKLKGVYDDDRIRNILAEKVRDKERRLEDADAGLVRGSRAS